MNPSSRRAGATLVLTVLVMMLLLAGVVVVTGQVAVSARRSSADQQATVQAQYVAESGVARAQARLTLINTLMTKALKPPVTTTTSQMLGWMQSLCSPSPVPPSAKSSFEKPVALCSAAGSKNPADLLSTVPDLKNSPNLNLFTANIADAAYAEAGYPLDGDVAASERLFWAQSLRPDGVTIKGPVGAGGSSVSGSVGLALRQVERFGLDSYRLTFQLPGVVSTAAALGSGRKIKVQGSSDNYFYEISRGSFAKYALFTNNHVIDADADAACNSDPGGCSRVTFTSNTVFSGPVHTNQSFTIRDSPYFAGPVESAGCPGGAANDAAGNPATTCAETPTPGAYVRGRGLVPASDISGEAPVFCTVSTQPCPPGSVLASPQFQGGVTWDAPFQPLPTNANDQAAAAANGGLYLSGEVSSLKVAVGQIALPGSGATLKAQLIDAAQSGAGKDSRSQLAVTPDKKVYVNVGPPDAPVWRAAQQLSTGLWADASLPLPAGVSVRAALFNGVIYTPNSIADLRGPPRTVADDPASAPPALADFSQLTIAASGDIHIKSDLKYEDPPCTGSNILSGSSFTAALCEKLTATNILGVYSAGGDVNIDSPDKYPADEAVGKDVMIQAVLMASRKSVRVDGYNVEYKGGDLGKVNLLGGIIENYYGAFGQFDVNTGNNQSGFGRNFVYDQRTGEGLAPPAFPTQQAWTTDFKQTTDALGAYLQTPLKLDGSQTQQRIEQPK